MEVEVGERLFTWRVNMTLVRVWEVPGVIGVGKGRVVKSRVVKARVVGVMAMVWAGVAREAVSTDQRSAIRKRIQSTGAT